MTSDERFETYIAEQRTLYRHLVASIEHAISARTFEYTTTMVALASGISLAIIQAYEFRNKQRAAETSNRTVGGGADGDVDMSDDRVGDLT